MLLSAVESLARSNDVTVICRTQSSAQRVRDVGGRAIQTDYTSSDFAEDLDPSFDLAVAWIHGKDLRPHVAVAALAERYVHVLGSAAANPSDSPFETDDIEQCVDLYQQVVLGFVISDGRSRWLSDTEISEGVLDAIRTKQVYSVVGVVEPWSARP